MSKNNYVQIDLKPALEFEGYRLYHAGKSSASGERYVPYHQHYKYYELTVVTKGKGISYTKNIPSAIEEGDIYLSFPYEDHQIDSDGKDKLSYSFICFEATNPDFSGKLKNLWFERLPPENRIIRNDMVKHLISAVIDELLDSSGRYSDKLISAYLEQITIYLLRGFADRNSDILPKTPTDEELCKHISHYIDTHLFSMDKLSDCAKALSYNYCYLTTVFRKTTGLTLSEYYRAKKLDMSKLLIADKEQSISEIAEALGYSGISSFSKAFRARFGISPGAYKRKTQA